MELIYFRRSLEALDVLREVSRARELNSVLRAAGV
jgi:hypothetical protein